MVEEAHETDFRRALQIAAIVAAAVKYQGSRRAGRGIGAECHLVQKAHRQRAPAACLQIEIEDFGFDVTGAGAQRGQ